MKEKFRILLASAASVALAAPAHAAASVSFKAVFESGSAWDGKTAAQDAMREMLGQFSKVMRASGKQDKVIGVYFTDNESRVGASVTPGEYKAANIGGTLYQVPISWNRIVRGHADPDGEIQANGTGADFTVNWNFGLIPKPENDKGVLRHELLHGLGMLGYSRPGLPTMTTGTTDIVQSTYTTTNATVHDRYIYDFNGDPVLGSQTAPDSTTYYVNKPIATDSDWEDANGSGVYFKGINDDGSERKIWLDAKNANTERIGFMDVQHPLEVSYSGVGGTATGLHPTWNTVEEVDRAYLRGLGYTIVPEPSSLLLAGIALFGLAFSRKR